MATLHHFTLFPPTFTPPAPRPPPPTTVALAAAPYPRRARGHRADRCRGACGYMVVVEHGGGRAELEVGPEETVLEKALDAGMEVPHDCKLGVCMTCPARLLNGAVDQSEGMLSDDVVSRGYALLCVSYPRSDCHIRTIPEEELLSLQLATAND